ncbi:MAG TPA: hypothetical protein VJ870_03065 [Amycolatopsis sp.]|nr:hypothetical protein [Amycolatopsis sp.]
MSPRRVLTACALTLVFLSSTPAAAAGPPLISGSCSAIVSGQPGEQLALDPAAVATPIAQELAKLDPLGVLTKAFPGQWAAAGPIPLATVPNGQLQLSGDTIADAVTQRLGQLPLLGPVLQTLTPTVHQTLSSACEILVRVVHPAAAPPAAAPGSPGSPGGTGPAGTGGRSAPAQAAPGTGPAGGGVMFGSPLPDDALVPLSVDGAPGASGADAAPWPPPIAMARRDTRSATALPANRDALSTPTLTALLLLSVVSGLLVHRWVLRGRA